MVDVVSREAEEEAREFFARTERRIEEFCRKIEKSVPKLKKEIAEKREIYVAPEDLGKKLGLGLLDRRRHPTGIYWDAKYCLWKEDIFLTSKRTDGQTRVIRARMPEDELPKKLMTREEAVRKLALELQRTGRVAPPE